MASDNKKGKIKMIKPYISLARIDNWSKNLLMLAGAGIAYVLGGASLDVNTTVILLTFFSLCFASSANYVLNESIDADSDKHHPIKKNRAAAKQTLRKDIITLEYIFLLLLALTLAFFAHKHILIVLVVYIFAAWLYNIPPIRLKDKAHADVLLESANYPIRILLGWVCIMPDTLPPSSIILTTWAIGAFTMSLKRVAEYRMFEDPKKAAAYRKSYAQYTRNTLTLSGFIYGMVTTFGITVIMLKYKTELVLLIPILIGWMGLYFLMSLRQNLEIIYPERLIKNKAFLVLTFITTLAGIILINVDIPSLQILNERIVFGIS